METKKLSELSLTEMEHVEGGMFPIGGVLSVLGGIVTVGTVVQWAYDFYQGYNAYEPSC